MSKSISEKQVDQMVQDMEDQKQEMKRLKRELSQPQECICCCHTGNHLCENPCKCDCGRLCQKQEEKRINYVMVGDKKFLPVAQLREKVEGMDTLKIENEKEPNEYVKLTDVLALLEGEEK